MVESSRTRERERERGFWFFGRIVSKYVACRGSSHNMAICTYSTYIFICNVLYPARRSRTDIRIFEKEKKKKKKTRLSKRFSLAMTRQGQGQARYVFVFVHYGNSWGRGSFPFQTIHFFFFIFFFFQPHGTELLAARIVSKGKKSRSSRWYVGNWKRF